MANTASTPLAFQSPVSTIKPAKRILSLFTILSFSFACAAQDAPAPASGPAQGTTSTITIPAGTPFSLVLTEAVSSKSLHRGDDIHAQFTSPIVVGNQVAIPAGTFVQGKIDKLSRNGSRGLIRLQSAALILPGGSVTTVPGPLDVESDEGTAWLNPSTGAKVGSVVAPLAGLGLGAAIGSAAHTTQSSTLGGTTITSATPKGIAIGSIVGLAAGGVISLVLITRSHQFYVEPGSPMQMALPQPITLDQKQVDAANHAAQTTPVAVRVPLTQTPYPVATAPTNHGTCFTPGTPGTPPTVIPGVPGPNGIPGPPTVVPGTPPTPGTPYPCP
jgi:type IV secretion system protein VirB10